MDVGGDYVVSIWLVQTCSDIGGSHHSGGWSGSHKDMNHQQSTIYRIYGKIASTVHLGLSKENLKCLEIHKCNQQSFKRWSCLKTGGAKSWQSWGTDREATHDKPGAFGVPPMPSTRRNRDQAMSLLQALPVRVASGNFYIAIEYGPVEIVSLPIKMVIYNS